jgi:hypothetical protein
MLRGQGTVSVTSFHVRLPYQPELVWRRLRSSGVATVALEWTVLALWSLSLTSPLFNFGPDVSTGGGEYFAQIQNQFIWDQFRTCGACAFWNGNVDGGYPAFADPFSAMLYPTVVTASIVFGARDGAMIAMIATFFLAGIAQWWLARELGLGSVARLWSGAMAIVAGRLASQLDQGMYVFIVSTVAAWFVLPSLVRVTRDARYRSAALLGIAIGFFLVSGQGYLQIGAALLSPLALFLVFGSKWPFWLLIRRLLLAVGIGLLLAAPFLVPLLHFLPSFGKYLDPSFGETQPFRYIPLNFVIKDAQFFRSGSLGAPVYPYLSVNYVGWVAVLLAAIGVGGLVVRGRWWLCSFLTGWVVLAMWIASATPLRLARDRTTAIEPLWEFIVGIRNPAVIAGLALPALLALAAIGLDDLWRRVAQYRLALKVDLRDGGVGRMLRVDPRWLLAVALLLAALDARQFARSWIVETALPEDVPAVLDALETPGAEWIGPPYGELYWAGAALDRNMKLSGTYFKAWIWQGRESPHPAVQAVRGEAPPDGTVVNSVGSIQIVEAPPGSEYAAVMHRDGSRTACLASSRGGNITVRCDAAQPGILQVTENHYSGWSAKVNGEDAPIEPVGQWMGVPVPAGPAEVQLRYRPWDVMAGLALMIAGVALAAWCLIWADRQRVRGDASDCPVTVPPTA